ncbi:MAG: spore cortex biosynthesis protein YabQ, partial [Clostridia bacterium]|nr:spore cortex biosynthesis protein YabQ [Clostridia bacterium]
VLSVALGVFICIVYDLLRAARDYKRPGRVLVFLADVLFFVFCSVVIFSFLQLFSNGQPRFYILQDYGFLLRCQSG